jgi:hypothetical protein
MAEAVGLAASIAGLAGLTIQLAQVSFQYVSSVHGASKAVSSYLQELSALTSVLLRLHTVVDIPDIQKILADRPFAISTSAIDECQTQLKELKLKLEHRISKDGFLANLKPMTWPFEEKETKRIVDKLHRFHDIFHSAVSSDTMCGISSLGGF